MPARYRGTPREARALDAFIALVRASEAVSTSLDRALARSRVSRTQLGVLEALRQGGPMPQCELARKLSKSPPNMTAVLGTLERRGLVRRRRAADRRVLEVELTPAGRRFVEGQIPKHVRRIVEVLAPLGTREQEELRRLCHKLGLGAKRERKRR